MHEGYGLAQNGYMSLSVCFIAKNEEKWIGECIDHLKSIVSEFIVVDTGSTDRTMDIAREKGARVSSIKWENDFSKARNASLEKATGRWILIIDPDERIADLDLPKIVELTKDSQVMAYSFMTRNYTTNSLASGFTPCTGQYAAYEKDYPGYFESGKVRLFQNVPNIRFVGSVHELVETTVKGKTVTTPIPFHHYGSTQEVQKEKNKRSFYQAQARQKVGEEPKNWKAHFEMGIEFLEVGEYRQACEALKKARDLNPKEALVLSNYGYALVEAGKHDEAEQVLTACLQLDAKNHDALLNLGVNEMRRKNWEKALACFDHLIKVHPRSFLAFRNAGNCFARLKKLKEAAGCFEHSLKIYPEYADARIDLGIVCFAGGRLDLAEKILGEALHQMPSSLRAQALLDEIKKAKSK